MVDPDWSTVVRKSAGLSNFLVGGWFSQSDFLSSATSSSSTFSPKGTVTTVVVAISALIFRHALSSTCQTAVSALTSGGTPAISGIGNSIAEVVVAVGSIDLVVGELDR